MMKNAFYFTLLFSRYLNFCLEFLMKKGLIRKVNFKIYDSTIWLKIITIHILSSISRSKRNPTMKFGQSTESNTRKFFFEKLCTKNGEETIPRPFSKKPKLTISLNQWYKVFCSLFLLYVKLRVL